MAGPGTASAPRSDRRLAAAFTGLVPSDLAPAPAELSDNGKVYELTGPRLLSFTDVAAELSKATGRTIRYTPLTPDEYVQILKDNDLPVEFVELFTNVLDGRNAHVADGVRQALGREPRDFADYARAAAATGVWDA
jgi:uncharacterized protein YbjT (DUF2867 family)